MEDHTRNLLSAVDENRKCSIFMTHKNKKSKPKMVGRKHLWLSQKSSEVTGLKSVTIRASCTKKRKI
jgi:hypothetical protein